MCEGCGDLSEVLYGPAASNKVPDDVTRLDEAPYWMRLLMSGETLLTLAIGALVANVSTHSPLFSAALAATSLTLLSLLRTRPIAILKHLIVPSYLTVVAIMTQLFFTGQTPLFHLGPVVAYEEGLAQGILLGSKIIGGTCILILFGTMIRTRRVFVATQPAPLGFSWWQILAARLHLPATLVDIAVLTYRYLFLLAEEAERIRQAQANRLGHRTGWTSVKSFGTLIGMIVVRSYDRAERVHEAMLLRGYNGNVTGTVEMARNDPSGFLVAIPLVILLLWVGQAI